MERTWKPTAAGILCIIAGIISVIPAIAFALLFARIGVGWLGAIGVPLIIPIPGIIAIVGGIYALRRRIWGLALAGSICTLVGSVILVMLIMIAAGSDNPEFIPFGTTWPEALAIFLSDPQFVGFIVVLGILGILPIIFVIRGKHEFK